MQEKILNFTHNKMQSRTLLRGYFTSVRLVESSKSR